MSRYDALLKDAHEFADSCRAIINETKAKGYSQEIKLDRSIVTAADKAAEERFRDAVMKRHPKHGILGEEFGEHQPGAEFRWVIDPIDGTEDFVRGIPSYGTIIGLFNGETPILGILDFPGLNERYYALKGGGAYRDKQQLKIVDLPTSQKITGEEFLHITPRNSFLRYGDTGELFDVLAKGFPRHRILFTCLSHAYAASGTFDATVEWNLRLWDLAAAQVLIEEAGGAYKIVKNERDKSGAILSAVMGKPRLVQRIVEMLEGRAPLSPP